MKTQQWFILINITQRSFKESHLNPYDACHSGDDEVKQGWDYNNLRETILFIPIILTSVTLQLTSKSQS